MPRGVEGPARLAFLRTPTSAFTPRKKKTGTPPGRGAAAMNPPMPRTPRASRASTPIAEDESREVQQTNDDATISKLCESWPRCPEGAPARSGAWF